MQHTFSERARSIAGAALIGLGIFILHKNLDQAAIQLNHLFSTPRETFGVLPTAMLAALRMLQAYTSDHQRFVQGLLQHMLVTFWPLLLVIAGTALSRESVADGADATTKKDCGIVDLTVRRSTLK